MTTHPSTEEEGPTMIDKTLKDVSLESLPVAVTELDMTGKTTKNPTLPFTEEEGLNLTGNNITLPLIDDDGPNVTGNDITLPLAEEEGSSIIGVRASKIPVPEDIGSVSVDSESKQEPRFLNASFTKAKKGANRNIRNWLYQAQFLKTLRLRNSNPPGLKRLINPKSRKVLYKNKGETKDEEKEEQDIELSYMTKEEDASLMKPGCQLYVIPCQVMPPGLMKFEELPIIMVSSEIVGDDVVAPEV